GHAVALADFLHLLRQRGGHLAPGGPRPVLADADHERVPRLQKQDQRADEDCRDGELRQIIHVRVRSCNNPSSNLDFPPYHLRPAWASWSPIRRRVYWG